LRCPAISTPHQMKHWQIIADDLATIGWTWVCVSTVGSGGERSVLLTRIAATETFCCAPQPGVTYHTSFQPARHPVTGRPGGAAGAAQSAGRPVYQVIPGRTGC
jgi:hypothetical protein